MKVALAQVEAKFGDKESNIEKTFEYIDKAKKQGAKLIIFPELSLTGYPQDFSDYDIHSLAEPIPGSTTDLLSQSIKNQSMEVIVGLPEKFANKVFDTVVLLKKDNLQKYRKAQVHWSEPFTPGNELTVYETVLGQLGILICFDASFSEPARILALKGAKTIAVPSAVPREFGKYARKRMIARALDNQVYILYCNACGRGFAGNSLIVDPRGEIIAESSNSEELLFGTLNYNALDRWREKEKIFPNRRPELYSKIVNS